MAVKKAIKLPKDIVQGYKNKWNFSCTWTENGKCMTPDYAYQIVNETDGHPIRFGKRFAKSLSKPCSMENYKKQLQ